MIDPEIEGRVAVVTGGNHGIGAAVARALAAQGARVFITYLRLPPEQTDASFPTAYAGTRAQAADTVVSQIRERNWL